MKKTQSKVIIPWMLYDAENKILGRLASEIAIKLMGKDKIDYKVYKPNNIRIVVINSKKIKVTGDKLMKKKYYRHTGYPGGLKTDVLNFMIKNKPNYVLRNAVKGMLPKNKLQKIFLKQLKIYENNIHPHTVQISQIGSL
ncbi:MAG TPA: 50S ribosomal protein L13 [Candidatus Azoamicus sp. OHIO2]